MGISKLANRHECSVKECGKWAENFIKYIESEYIKEE